MAMRCDRRALACSCPPHGLFAHTVVWPLSPLTSRGRPIYGIANPVARAPLSGFRNVVSPRPSFAALRAVAAFSGGSAPPRRPPRPMPWSTTTARRLRPADVAAGPLMYGGHPGTAYMPSAVDVCVMDPSSAHPCHDTAWLCQPLYPTMHCWSEGRCLTPAPR